jgi:large conductance mechanosensitive channel
MKRIAGEVSGFFGEFWKFAAKGNMFELAIGVVLGTAFGAIVNSLVKDIITPFISLATGSTNFSTWTFVLREATVIGGREVPALVIGYGNLLQAALNFLIVGLSIFIFYKMFVNFRMRFERREAEEEKATPPDPVNTQEKLLSEIRDILKSRTTGEQ